MAGNAWFSACFCIGTGNAGELGMKSFTKGNVAPLRKMADSSEPFGEINGSRERLARTRPFCYTTVYRFNSFAFANSMPGIFQNWLAPFIFMRLLKP